MNDPDDYGPLPDCPDIDSVPKHAWDEWSRKYDARRDATEHLEKEIAEDIRLGWEISAEETEQRVQERARMLANIQSSVKWEFEDRRKQRYVEETRHREVVEALETSTAYGAAKKFAKEHPFIAGVLGAEIVHKLKGK